MRDRYRCDLGVRVSSSTLATLPTTRLVDLAEPNRKDQSAQEDETAFVFETVFVPTSDGVDIPLSLVR